jgi:hypothetical protein
MNNDCDEGAAVEDAERGNISESKLNGGDYCRLYTAALTT